MRQRNVSRDKKDAHLQRHMLYIYILKLVLLCSSKFENYTRAYNFRRDLESCINKQVLMTC